MEIGSIINGRYFILAKLGEGGMGVVHHALDTNPNLNRPVALKTVRFDLPLSASELAEVRESLLREARTAARLNHPGIVTIHDAFEMGYQVVVVMEYIEGQSLKELLDKYQLSERQALVMLGRVAEALDYAHGKGVVHRDIKPSNIMIGPDDRVKVADFGIARESVRATLAGLTGRHSTVIGTPSYMSPEQINGLGVDGRSDQFSLAIMAHEALKRRLPFRAPTPTAIAAKIISSPPDLDPSLGPAAIRALSRALSRSPSGRFRTCQEFIAELQSALIAPETPPPAPVIEEEVTERTPKRKSRRRYIVGAVLLVVFIGLAIAASVSWSWLGDQFKRFRSPAMNPRDGVEYVWISPGSFQMGCVPDDATCDYDEKPRHQVTLTKGFWMSQKEVTVASFQRFATSSAIGMPDAPEFNSGWKDKNHPVVNVSWNEASAYCEWAGGRLPSEAEWEYAARGHKDGLLYPWGNPINHENGNYGGEKVGDGAALGRDQWQFTAPVGSFAPNGWGLYDMTGNVMEWVKDWYADKYYSETTSVDPRGPVSGNARIFRGGGWNSPARLLRSSWRYSGTESVKKDYIGFRCVSDDLSASQ